MKKPRPKKLLSERARLRAEIVRLSDGVAKLESEASLRWEVRAIHGDLDSVKHMVRNIMQKLGAGPTTGVEQFVNPDIGGILAELRGKYVDPGNPPPVDSRLRAKRRLRKKVRRRK